MAYVLAISNKISIQNYSDCETVLLKFKNTSDAYGFDYSEKPDFEQQVRIGGHLRSQKYPKKEILYRPSTGVFRRANTYIDKTKELHTDLLDEPTTDALVVALNHSNISIDEVDYSCQGDIDIEDNDSNNLTNVKATLYVHGFNKTNIACK